MIIFLNRPQQDPMLLEEETWKFTWEWKARYDQGVKCKTHLGHNQMKELRAMKCCSCWNLYPEHTWSSSGLKATWSWSNHKWDQESQHGAQLSPAKRTWGWEMETTAQEGSIRFFLPTEWRLNSNFSLHSVFNRYIQIQLPRVWQYFLRAYRGLILLLELENS